MCTGGIVSRENYSNILRKASPFWDSGIFGLFSAIFGGGRLGFLGGFDGDGEEEEGELVRCGR